MFTSKNKHSANLVSIIQTSKYTLTYNTPQAMISIKDSGTKSK